MAEQLTFDLPAKPALGRDAFFVSPSNALAVKRLECWQDWPDGRLVLCGPAGAGKTHLAHVWASEAGATLVEALDLNDDLAARLSDQTCLVVENADRVAGNLAQETALFHLYNLLASAGGYLLLTAATAPARWALDLPDLKSRLQSVSIVDLDAPDDALLAALLVKLFDDRQIGINAELIPYLVSRMDRSADAAQNLVAALDRAALEQKRAVTRRLAAEVLDKL